MEEPDESQLHAGVADKEARAEQQLVTAGETATIENILLLGLTVWRYERG